MMNDKVNVTPLSEIREGDYALCPDGHRRRVILYSADSDYIIVDAVDDPQDGLPVKSYSQAEWLGMDEQNKVPSKCLLRTLDLTGRIHYEEHFLVEVVGKWIIHHTYTACYVSTYAGKISGIDTADLCAMLFKANVYGQSLAYGLAYALHNAGVDPLRRNEVDVRRYRTIIKAFKAAKEAVDNG